MSVPEITFDFTLDNSFAVDSCSKLNPSPNGTKPQDTEKSLDPQTVPCVQRQKSTSCQVKNESVYYESIPDYHDFFRDIFLKNQLCTLGSHCTESWASRKQWVTDQGTPNFEFIRQHFGESMAPVTNCDSSVCSNSTKYEMTVSEFVDYWEKYQADGHPVDEECVYLKDWHFTRDFPTFHAYSPPSLLCSDWLNEFWDVRQDIEGSKGKADDYRFVYLGPKNTWTPFHSDVLRSYSWSANICGRKKWIFFPPGEEGKLRDQYGQLIRDVRDPVLKDPRKYPLAEKVLAEKAIVVVQNPGEVVFVPCGWHHQVFNLEDTISINHNWINGCSAHLTWAFLKAQQADVRKEIADCTSMDCFDSQCQRILKSDSGMNYIEFYNFLTTIAKHRTTALEVYHQYVTKGQKKDSNIPTGTVAATTDPCNDDDPFHTEPSHTGDNNDEAVDVYLCLWCASKLCTTRVTGQAKTDVIKSNVIVLSRNDKISSPGNPLPTEFSFRHSKMKRNQEATDSTCGARSLEFINGIKSDDLEYYDNERPNINNYSSSSTLSERCAISGDSVLRNDKPSERCNLKSGDDSGVENSKNNGDSGAEMSKNNDDSGADNSKNNEDSGAENSKNNGGSGAEHSKNDEDSGHESCPHWSHYGPRLAVFDLQRILVLLQDVTSQPEWTNIVEEAKVDLLSGHGILLEEYTLLKSDIENCLQKVMEYLCK